MAGTIVVARVAVRVYPDTKEFRKELQADLKKMQDVEVEVPVKPKLDNETADRVKAEIAAKFNEITVKIKAALSAVDVDVVKAKLDAEFAKARTATIKTTLSAVDLIKAKAEMDAMFAKNQKVKIKPVLDKLGAAQVEAWFMRLSGAQMLTDQIRAGINAFKELPAMVPGLILMVPAIAVVTAAILNMGGALLSLGRDVAKAVPILLAVPAVFLGMGLGLATLFVSFKKLSTVMPEVSKQFQDIKDTMQDSFWGTALNPVEKAFTTMLPRINAGMAAVGSSTGLWFADLMSKFSNTLPFETFFRAVAKMNVGLLPFNTALTSIFDTIFKMSSWLLPSFAAGLSNLTTKFADWFKTANDTGRLQTMIVTATQKFKDFWVLIVSVYNWLNALTRPLEDLNKMTIDSLAKSFQRGADDMNTALGQLNIKKVFESAQIAMSNFWTESHQGMSEFFNAMPDFMMKALPTLGTAGGKLADAIFGGLAGAMPGILKFFDAIAGAVDLLAPQIKEAVRQIGYTLGLDLAAMVTGFAPLLNDLLKMFNSMIGPLADTILHLSHGLQALLDPIMPYVNEIILAVGQGINKIAVILDDLMVFLAPYIAEIAKNLVPLIQKAIDGIIPVIKDMAQVIKDLMPVIGPILKFLLDLVGVVLNTVLPVLDLIFKELANVIETIKSMATTLAQAFDQLSKGDYIGAFTTLTNGIGGAWTNFINTTNANTAAAGQTIVENLSGQNATVNGPTVIDQMLQRTSDGINAWGISIAASIAAFWQAIDTGISAAMGPMPATVLSWLIVTGLNITGWFLDTINGFGVFAQAVNGAWNTLWSGVLSVTQAFSDMQQAAINAFLTAVLNVFSIFDWTLQDGVASAWGSIGSIISWALNGIQNSISSGWNLIQDITRTAWNILPDAVQAGINMVLNMIYWFPEQIMSAMGNLGGWLFNAGSSLMAGFFSGVVSWFNTITTALDNFTASLPFHKGPIELDRVLFKPAGIAIMQSLLNGFELGAKSIWDYLDTFTKDLAGTEFAATLSTNGSLVTNAMNAASNAASATGANASPSVQVTNYYPQAEPTSRTVNRALQLATLL